MVTREKRREYNARYRLKNVDKIRQAGRVYFLKNKEKIKERQLRMGGIYAANRRLKYRSDRAYRQKCIDRSLRRAVSKKALVNAYKKLWAKRKLKTDSLFRLKIILRRRIWMAIRNQGWTTKSSVLSLIGAEWTVVKDWIESKFSTGMSWDNHGDWHIDHVVPLASAKTESQLTKLLNYKNLQPLWAFDNLSKGAKK